MSSTAVLLVDADREMAAIIRERVANVDCCQVEETRGAHRTHERIRQGGVSLVLWCVWAGADPQKALRHLAAVRPYQVPVVAILDGEDQNVRAQLVAGGAVDCLMQPLDLARLGFLADILTVNAGCLPYSEGNPKQSPKNVYPL